MSRAETLAITLADRVVKFRGHHLALSKRFFELYCLLAIARLKSPQSDEGFVETEQIALLPSWGKNSLLSVGKQIRRHIQRKGGATPIESQQKVYGPFRLKVAPGQIRLDVELSRMESFLGSASRISGLKDDDQKRFYRFVEHFWRADRAFNDGKLKKALDHYQRAAEAAALPHHQVMALCSAARTLERQGNYDEALKLHSRAAGALKHTTEDHDWSEAKACATAAWIHWRKHRLNQAEQFYRKALTLVARKRDHQLLGEIYNGLGLLCKERGQYGEGLRFYQQALEACVLAEDYYGIQSAYFNIGRVHSMLGDQSWNAGHTRLSKDRYGMAVEWIRQCIALCQHLAIADDISDAEILLSHLYRRLGQIKRAWEAAIAANEIAIRAGNQRCIALSYRALAGVHILRGEADAVRAAIENCKKQVGQEFLVFLREEDILTRLQVPTTMDPRVSKSVRQSRAVPDEKLSRNS
ncbi:MAG TPA: tetratricopeptide repeat protein [Acidobacteriota bacterium]|jgi:tetratricopeptide (TPR) repeat protein